MTWDEPQRKRRRRTRRDEIYEWICDYADEMDGPTPSINEVATHFGLAYKTAYVHIVKLILEGRLRQDRRKLIVVRSEWLRPDTAEGRF